VWRKKGDSSIRRVFLCHPVVLFISFEGWNKTWDEWVTDERLLKINPENLEKQKEVEKEVQESKGGMWPMFLAGFGGSGIFSLGPGGVPVGSGS
jgi:hypothetical protein